MASVKVIPITEARSRLSELVDQLAQSKEPYFIASRSRVKAVLLGMEQYNALLEELEDLEDSLDALRGKLEAEKDGTVPWTEVRASFQAEASVPD